MASNDYCDSLPKAAREPEVSAAIASLQGSLGYLADTVSALEKRASPIARQPSEDSASSLGRAGSCPVAGTLFSATATLDALTNRIRDLTDRLEI